MRFGGAVLHKHRGTLHKGRQGGPVAGARARLEWEGEIRERHTVTRLVGPAAVGGAIAFPVGVLGLATGVAFKKRKDRRKLFLTVESPYFAFVIECKPDQADEARKFVMAVNRAGMEWARKETRRG